MVQKGMIEVAKEDLLAAWTLLDGKPIPVILASEWARIPGS